MPDYRFPREHGSITIRTKAASKVDILTHTPERLIIYANRPKCINGVEGGGRTGSEYFNGIPSGGKFLKLTPAAPVEEIHRTSPLQKPQSCTVNLVTVGGRQQKRLNSPNLGMVLRNIDRVRKRILVDDGICVQHPYVAI